MCTAGSGCQYENPERNRICEHMTIMPLHHSMFTVEKGQTLFRAGARESLGTRLVGSGQCNVRALHIYI